MTNGKKAPASTAEGLNTGSIIPEKPSFDNIPRELKARPQWVVRKGKIPINPLTGQNAKAGDPSTWAPFQAAVDAARSGGYDGIGFEFDNNGLVGIDLDTVRDPNTGEVATEATEIIQALASYTEVSPSGYGFHIICSADIALKWNKAPLPPNGIARPDIDPATGQQRRDKNGNPIFKQPEIEMYKQGRYFTMTGAVAGYSYSKLEKRDQQLQQIHNSYGKKPVTIAYDTVPQASGKNYLQIGLERDPKFKELWEGHRPSGDESSDDLSLMNKLAYWCNRDTEKMVEAFISSPYCAMKDQKHAKKTERRDYLSRTAQKAVASVQDTAAAKDTKFQTRKSDRTKLKEALQFTDAYETNDTNQELLYLDLNDSGNGQRLLHLFGDQVLYSPEMDQWYIWDGCRWEPDKTNKIYRIAIRTAKIFRNTALKYKSQEESDPVVKFARASGNLNRLLPMIKHVSAERYVLQDDLDNHNHLLNCKNGTLDLKTSKLLAPDPVLRLTKTANAAYKPDAACPVFTAFLDRIFNGDQELITFIQKTAGYIATGATSEQCIFVAYGNGANGKSTLVDALTGVLEDFTQTIPTDILMERQKGGTATPELARAKGARLVVAAESSDIACLNESQIKNLTGGDKIAARPLYAQGFDYKPNFKIWLSTNHKPTIKGTDNGIWRRVVLIPFTVTIPEEEQDPRLPEKLAAEREGILSWIAEGARRYYAEGLDRPAAVKSATDEYRTEMDILGGFLEDCIRPGDGNLLARTLFTAYQKWAAENGEKEISQTAFGRKMNERGYKKLKKGVCIYEGIQLSEHGEELLKEKWATVDVSGLPFAQ